MLIHAHIYTSLKQITLAGDFAYDMNSNGGTTADNFFRNIEPVAAVQQDGLGAQSSLYTGGVLKYNESEVGNLLKIE